MRLSISYEFYIKDILKTYRRFVKSFNFALLFICLYAMNDTEGVIIPAKRSGTSVALQDYHIFKGVVSGCDSYNSLHFPGVVVESYPLLLFKLILIAASQFK